MGILDELSFLYITLDDEDGKKAIAAEADSFEVEINECINKAQIVIKESMKAKLGQSVGESVSEQASLPPVQQASESNSSSIQGNTGQFQSRLKPLKLPVFDGSKTKFEDFGHYLQVWLTKILKHQMSKWRGLDRVSQALHYRPFKSLEFHNQNMRKRRKY